MTAPEGLNLRFVSSAFLLLSALILGGSGSRPDFEMVVAMIALVCLLLDTWLGAPATEGRTAALMITLCTAVPVVQLMPLPEQLWALLPQGQYGQTLPAHVSDHIVLRTLSIAPDDTLFSLIAALPALILLWLVTRLSRSETMLLISLLVASVILMAGIGILQATAGIATGLFDNTHTGVATGLFASRNNFADLLIIGAAMLLGLRSRWAVLFGKGVSELLVHSGMLVLLGAVISSTSRTGTVLFLALSAPGYLLSTPHSQRRRLVVGLIALTAASWLMLTESLRTGFIKTLASRFETGDETRWEIWQNCLRALKIFMPWGTGIGTFRSAYEQLEPIDNIIPSYVNAAHNEYLQLLIEAGMLGAAVGIILLCLILVGLARNRENPLAQFAAIALVAVLLHAADDYPFRVVASNVSIAFLCALLVRHEKPRVQTRSEPECHGGSKAYGG